MSLLRNLNLGSVPALAFFVSTCQFPALFTLSAPGLRAQETFEELLEVGGGSLKRGRLEEAAEIFLQALDLT